MQSSRDVPEADRSNACTVDHRPPTRFDIVKDRCGLQNDSLYRTPNWNGQSEIVVAWSLTRRTVTDGEHARTTAMLVVVV